MSHEGKIERATTEIQRQADQKDWQQPVLRRLPIAATRGSGKALIMGNDGIGGGKGDVSILHS
jgi:hypothetical protein